jgi:4-alpha-glucanotransferase
MKKRSSGMLLHITSLPSDFGIGDLGPGAFRFVDFLAQSGQSSWQVLPLTPTDTAAQHSPYHSVSTFAGNPLLISPQLLIEEGYLEPADVSSRPRFPSGLLDFQEAASFKNRILSLAFQRFRRKGETDDYRNFCREHESWLHDFALFSCLVQDHPGRDLSAWPPALRDRSPELLKQMARDLRMEMDRIKYCQYLFFRQWEALRTYAHTRGVQLIGDLPIYVTLNSVEVWTHPEIFDVDRLKNPRMVAGVPPDYFSKTGQLWGNPLYRWDILQQQGYAWWLQRFAHNLKLYDRIRIDHFRGFVAYWAVPAQEKNAARGRWVEAPAEDFFHRVLSTFPEAPLIAEDLGTITPDVQAVMRQFGLPGMKVLLFAFGEDDPDHPYLPHTYPTNCIVYTGTHDNNTARGWFEMEATAAVKNRLFRYLERRTTARDVAWDLIHLGMSSAAGLAITPLQDLLGLGAEARMNRPGTTRGNWRWRVEPGSLTPALSDRLRELTKSCGRLEDPPQP